MARYIGIQQQIRRNNTKSFFLLLGFPVLLLGLVYVVAYVLHNPNAQQQSQLTVNDTFITIAPWVVGIVAVWFLIAFLGHTKMINSATHAKTLQRKENMRVYNLVENLCISLGMPLPKIQIIEDRGLNAFASGLSEKTFAVTLTRGIIDALDDEELEGVIAHELMHIQNRDVRLLVITIIFVGIFSFIVQILFRNMLFGGGRRNGKNNNKGLILILVAAGVAFLISQIFKFALSRKREYMADAGAAEITKRPQALASALRKISGNSKLSNLKSDEVKDLFIDNYIDKGKKGFLSTFSSIFATHPPIEKRIAALEAF